MRTPTAIVFIASIIFVASVAGLVTIRSALGQPEGLKESPARWDMAESIKNVDLVTQWARNEFGFAIANFTIFNKNDRGIRDLVVTCDFFRQSGDRIDSKPADIFEIFNAKSNRTVRGVNVGLVHSQARGGACNILRLAKSASAPAGPKNARTGRWANDI